MDIPSAGGVTHYFQAIPWEYPFPSGGCVSALQKLSLQLYVPTLVPAFQDERVSPLLAMVSSA